MAPHLTPKEIDLLMKLAAKGANAVKLHRHLAAQRARRGIQAPTVTNIRKLANGRTYKRGVVEKRGRPAKLSHSNVMRHEEIKIQKSKQKIRFH